jgi:ribonuclease J
LDNNDNNKPNQGGEHRPHKTGNRRRRRPNSGSQKNEILQAQIEHGRQQEQKEKQDPRPQGQQSPGGGDQPSSSSKRRRRRRSGGSQGDQQQAQQQQQAASEGAPKGSRGGRGGRNRQGGQGKQQEGAQARQQKQQDASQAQQPKESGKKSGRGGGGRGQQQPRQQQQRQGQDQERQGGSRSPRTRRPRRDEEGMDRRPVRQHHAGHTALKPIGDDTLRVIPLGGVGEVGKNMTAVECGNDIVLLDAGGKFPEEEQRGIDLIIPDISFIVERMRNFRGILLTHGHEDHIGGLPYIIPQIEMHDGGKVPIYGTPLALGFVDRKLSEARLDDRVELHPVHSGSRVKLGVIEAEFIHVTHSIPDACAIAIHTPVGTIVDTGDFKFDPTPVMGAPTDIKRFERIGRDGVLALFSDTVRVEQSGSTPSEKVVLDTFIEEIGNAKGQVIIATFASNVSRVMMALHAAEKHGRKVAVAGRSMEQNSRVALDLGYLDPPEGLFVPLEELLRMPKEKRVIVSTGSQGEAAAALSRIAAGEHPKIRVSRGDKIIVSATPIPGNETTVSNTLNNLFRRGVDVVYSALDRGVHVSGHAGRDELRRMIDMIKPKYTVPIHGEFRHMALYRELSVEAGIRRENILLPEIGGVIEFTKKDANQRGRVKAGNILVDRLGDRGGNAQTVLRTRENLTDDGFVVVTLIVDRATGDLVAGPYLIGKGLAKELNNGALKEAENELKRMLGRRKEGATQLGYAIQRTKETVGKVLYRRSRTRPLVLPVVTEL